MHETFKNFKHIIEEKIKSAITKNVNNHVELSKVAAQRLIDACLGGKMVRGGCILLLADSFAANKTDAIQAAAAIEIAHAAILIHDDIIDKDALRRGKPAVHTLYSYDRQTESNPQHYGTSMAICVGDIGTFLASKLFAELAHPNAAKITSYFSLKMMECGLGEMQDIYLSEHKNATTDDIHIMHYLKTSTYSFQIPFVVAAMLADQQLDVMKNLEELGEILGSLFQIRDDDLDIFSDQEHLGRPTGSDLLSEKQTIHLTLLRKGATKYELDELQTLIKHAQENNKLAPHLVNTARSLLRKYKIDQQVQDYYTIKSKRATILISQLPIHADKKEILEKILLYMYKREA
jgi:geranylgeranyl diphosphate synthase type I